MLMQVFSAVALALTPIATSATPPAEVSTSYTLARTSVFLLRSADGHDYRVMVAWPDGEPPDAGWPALYVLDGEDNFAIVVQTLRRLARAGARSGVEDHLVVAIDSGGLPRRVFDYTPSTPGWAIPAGAPAAGLKTGGADAFLDFISRTVAPEIARRWQVDSQRRALIGHSFGGLVGVHMYLTRPDMFAKVTAISPSLWFGGDLLARRAAARQPTSSRMLIITGGEERGPGGAVIANADAFAEQVGARFHSLPGQSHGSTLLAGLGPALAFLCEGEDK